MAREISGRPLKLDDDDVATILAALRMFQRTYEGRDGQVIREDWPGYFDDAIPLGSDDIDELCERINTEGK